MSLDVRNIITPMRLPYENQQARRDECLAIDFAQIPGLGTVGTSKLIDIPAGRVIDEVRIVVRSNAVGAGTVQPSIGGTALGTAITAANLTAGKVHNLTPNNLKVFDEKNATTLDLIIAGGDLTSGQIMLFYSYYDLPTFYDAG